MMTKIHAFTALIFSVLLSISGCTSQESSDPVAPPVNSPQTLTVTTGSGGGTYTGGDTVNIWANPYPAGQVFDKWTGDVAALTDIYAWHTALTMPASSVNLTATYKSAPAWTAQYEVINGSNVYSYFPAFHKGVITLYHGSGGNARSWMKGTDGETPNVESQNFCWDAVAAGYAVIATESTDRIADPNANKQWDNAFNNPANPDVLLIKALIDTFKARGKVAASEPVYSVGMSNGGGFSCGVASVLSFKAAGIFCVPGLAQIVSQTTVPMIWCLAQNDVNEDPTRNTEAATNRNTLANRGIGTALYINPPSPVYPYRLWRIAGIDSAGSRLIYNALKSNGYLDGKDYLTINPKTTTTWTAVIPAPYNANFYLGDIGDQLAACYAEHKFYSDFGNKVIKFFDAHF
ncbi:MAG: hypothetical protein IAF08_07895 [Rhizobacter sp.]|nr:hypothetical protein [Chlorobiales bacterium]